MTSLGSIPALRVLSGSALAAVERDSRPARFPAGAMLRPYGEPARAVVLLLSGTVAAAHLAASGVEVWPEQWTGPAIADKPAVLDGGVPPTGLVALTAATARLLPRQDFLRLLDQEPALRAHVFGRLARDALTARRRLAQATTLPAVARLAAWLDAPERPHPVAWSGTQEQLARMLGLSRVSVNRALARLAGSGAVRRTGQGIVVADRATLRAVVNDYSE
ncbi:Crp/Fnr family transcriptional regulator [Jidongwangia harbinensis]|uniref:Crp/Fnr family transcriptional regulator n=1 Tax=Jidongwangia harbinensis TaxID=2878561 RepID=UPI001CD9E137|nr:Crp/Fnr family transcriptional regulator [Jidongwangia harbinensis]MCA2215964.1 Crp/Fnr family transcriptional regulator [Jidongwangia harbinensis]